MGCDIHAYIDYDETLKDERVHTSSFGRVQIPRNYVLFAALVGVRNDGWVEPVAEPNGLPERLSWRTEEDYYLTVDDEAEAKGWERYCSEDQAARWVRQGVSSWGPPHPNPKYRRISHPDWHSTSWFTVPELEEAQRRYALVERPAASWSQGGPTVRPESLTHDGLEGLPVRVEKREGRFGPDCYVEVGERKPVGESRVLAGIIGALRGLEGDQSGSARLVFWFDN